VQKKHSKYAIAKARAAYARSMVSHHEALEMRSHLVAMKGHAEGPIADSGGTNGVLLVFRLLLDGLSWDKIKLLAPTEKLISLDAISASLADALGVERGHIDVGYEGASPSGVAAIAKIHYANVPSGQAAFKLVNGSKFDLQIIKNHLVSRAAEGLGGENFHWSYLRGVHIDPQSANLQSETDSDGDPYDTTKIELAMARLGFTGPSSLHWAGSGATGHVDLVTGASGSTSPAQQIGSAMGSDDKIGLASAHLHTVEAKAWATRSIINAFNEAISYADDQSQLDRKIKNDGLILDQRVEDLTQNMNHLDTSSKLSADKLAYFSNYLGTAKGILGDAITQYGENVQERLVSRDNEGTARKSISQRIATMATIKQQEKHAKDIAMSLDSHTSEVEQKQKETERMRRAQEHARQRAEEENKADVSAGAMRILEDARKRSATAQSLALELKRIAVVSNTSVTREAIVQVEAAQTKASIENRLTHLEAMNNVTRTKKDAETMIARTKRAIDEKVRVLNEVHARDMFQVREDAFKLSQRLRKEELQEGKVPDVAVPSKPVPPDNISKKVSPSTELPVDTATSAQTFDQKATGPADDAGAPNELAVSSASASTGLSASTGMSASPSGTGLSASPSGTGNAASPSGTAAASGPGSPSLCTQPCMCAGGLWSSCACCKSVFSRQASSAAAEIAKHNENTTRNAADSLLSRTLEAKARAETYKNALKEKRQAAIDAGAYSRSVSRTFNRALAAFEKSKSDGAGPHLEEASIVARAREDAQIAAASATDAERSALRLENLYKDAVAEFVHLKEAAEVAFFKMNKARQASQGATITEVEALKNDASTSIKAAEQKIQNLAKIASSLSSIVKLDKYPIGGTGLSNGEFAVDGMTTGATGTGNVPTQSIVATPNFYFSQAEDLVSKLKRVINRKKLQLVSAKHATSSARDMSTEGVPSEQNKYILLDAERTEANVQKSLGRAQQALKSAVSYSLRLSDVVRALNRLKRVKTTALQLVSNEASEPEVNNAIEHQTDTACSGHYLRLHRCPQEFNCVFDAQHSICRSDAHAQNLDNYRAGTDMSAIRVFELLKKNNSVLTLPNDRESSDQEKGGMFASSYKTRYISNSTSPSKDRKPSFESQNYLQKVLDSAKYQKMRDTLNEGDVAYATGSTGMEMDDEESASMEAESARDHAISAAVAQGKARARFTEANAHVATAQAFLDASKHTLAAIAGKCNRSKAALEVLKSDLNHVQKKKKYFIHEAASYDRAVLAMEALRDKLVGKQLKDLPSAIVKLLHSKSNSSSIEFSLVSAFRNLEIELEETKARQRSRCDSTLAQGMNMLGEESTSGLTPSQYHAAHRRLDKMHYDCIKAVQKSSSTHARMQNQAILKARATAQQKRQVAAELDENIKGLRANITWKASSEIPQLESEKANASTTVLQSSKQLMYALRTQKSAESQLQVAKETYTVAVKRRIATSIVLGTKSDVNALGEVLGSRATKAGNPLHRAMVAAKTAARAEAISMSTQSRAENEAQHARQVAALSKTVEDGLNALNLTHLAKNELKNVERSRRDTKHAEDHVRLLLRAANDAAADKEAAIIRKLTHGARSESTREMFGKAQLGNARRPSIIPGETSFSVSTGGTGSTGASGSASPAYYPCLKMRDEELKKINSDVTSGLISPAQGAAAAKTARKKAVACQSNTKGGNHKVLGLSENSSTGGGNRLSHGVNRVFEAGPSGASKAEMIVAQKNVHDANRKYAFAQNNGNDSTEKLEDAVEVGDPGLVKAAKREVQIASNSIMKARRGAQKSKAMKDAIVAALSSETARKDVPVAQEELTFNLRQKSLRNSTDSLGDPLRLHTSPCCPECPACAASCNCTALSLGHNTSGNDSMADKDIGNSMKESGEERTAVAKVAKLQDDLIAGVKLVAIASKDEKVGTFPTHVPDLLANIHHEKAIRVTANLEKEADASREASSRRGQIRKKILKRAEAILAEAIKTKKYVSGVENQRESKLSKKLRIAHEAVLSSEASQNKKEAIAHVAELRIKTMALDAKEKAKNLANAVLREQAAQREANSRHWNNVQGISITGASGLSGSSGSSGPAANLLSATGAGASGASGPTGHFKDESKALAAASNLSAFALQKARSSSARAHADLEFARSSMSEATEMERRARLQLSKNFMGREALAAAERSELEARDLVRKVKLQIEFSDREVEEKSKQHEQMQNANKDANAWAARNRQAEKELRENLDRQSKANKLKSSMQAKLRGTRVN
jgi:hypothetical protein